MATLHRKLDRNYCIVGHVPGTGFCTWQVGEDGLKFLKLNRNVPDEGEVVLSDLKQLIDEGLVWTGGAGPSGAGSISSTSEIPYGVIQQLVEWARHGRIDDLASALTLQGRDFWDKCFCRSFLKWLESLDPNVTLGDFDGMSSADFIDLAGKKLHRIASPLHEYLVQDSWTTVPWRLSRIIGRVAQHAELSDESPVDWQDRFPVLTRIFILLKGFFEDQESRVDRPKLPRAKRLRARLVSPCIRWDVDDQSVKAVLPAQQIAPGETIHWQVTGVDVPQPARRQDADAQQTEEVRSVPLDPAPAYEVTVDFRSSTSRRVTERQRITLPSGYTPFVLFSPDGYLLSPDDASPLTPGEYLALVPSHAAPTAKGLNGVNFLDNIDFEPIGWEDFQAYRVNLAASTDVWPYQVTATDTSASWEAEHPPEYGVRFLSGWPVWIERWPALSLSDQGSFGGAVLKIEIEGSGSPANLPRHLRVGHDVSIVERNNTPTIELSSAPQIQDMYGLIRITCRLPAYPDLPPLICRLFRCRDAQFAYIEDPEAPDRAAAVTVVTQQRVHAGADTELLNTGDTIILRARNPVDSPVVTCFLPDSGGQLSIRVPVTRLRNISREGLSPWCKPPLTVGLTDVRLDDYLRVELHVPPILEDGQLLCRLVGGAEVAAGKATDLPNTYVIPLHRWRDDSRLLPGGTIQVRSDDRWIDIVRLQPRSIRQRPTREEPPPPSFQNERQKLISDLDNALAGYDEELAIQLVNKLLKRAQATAASVVDCELLPVVVARAYLHLGNTSRAEEVLSGLVHRTDLAEVQLTQSKIQLRTGRLQRPDELKGAKVAVERAVADCPQKTALLAEFDYHYASQPGKSTAIWSDCFHAADKALRMVDAASWPLQVERLDSLLLKTLSSFMLAREPVSTQGLHTEGPWAWLEYLEFAARFLRTPWCELADRSHVPSESLPVLTILRPDHAALIKLMICQATGRILAAAEIISEFAAWSSDEFFAIDLLRARQARLESKAKVSAAFYNQALTKARQDGPDFLLELLLEEIPIPPLS